MSATAETPTTLDALVESIKANCALLAQAETSALDHAIAVGHDLSKAKALVPGSWMDWVAVNVYISVDLVHRYMRFAHYEAKLRAAGATSINHAREIVAGLPATSQGRPATPIDPRLIQRVRTGEMTATDAAIEAGVSPTTVTNRVNGVHGKTTRTKAQYRASSARRRRATVALREKEQARAAQKVGGNVYEGFALAKRTCQTVDWAVGETENREAKAHMATAWRRFDAGLQELNKAIGILYGA